MTFYNMKRKQKAKYLIAIYTIIVAVAIILWILAQNNNNEDVKSTLINLSTELLGVVVIFFVVNYFFALDEWELGERVEQLVTKLETQNTVSSKYFFHGKSDIKDVINNSTSIDMCGVILATTIDSNLSTIKEAIKNGSKIRILIIENTSDALQMAANRSELSDYAYYEKKLESSLHNINYLISNFNNNKGSIEVGYLKYPPSFGIKIFEKGQNIGNCLIEIYAHHVDWGDSPNFTLDKEIDKEWYNYFKRQFEAMWENRNKFESGTPPPPDTNTAPIII